MWQRRDLQQLYAEVMMSAGRQRMRETMGAQTPLQRLRRKAQHITAMVQIGSTSRANALLLRNATPYTDPHDYDRIGNSFS
eukprot:9666816-Prorocentrum_lima.AAC.1